jgi:hypothetical protein
LKRIRIAIILLVALLGICIGEQIYIKNFYVKLNDMVEIVLNSNDEKAINSINEYWQDNNDILYSIANHGSLDDLGESIKLLKKEDDKEIAVEEVKSALDNFYKNNNISISNIL